MRQSLQIEGLINKAETNQLLRKTRQEAAKEQLQQKLIQVNYSS